MAEYITARPRLVGRVPNARGGQPCPRLQTPKMPQMDSIDELARFWDTHDLTDFEDELEEVSESIFERR